MFESTETEKVLTNTSMFRSLLVNWPLNRDLIMSVGLRSTKIYLKEDEHDDEYEYEYNDDDDQ